MLRPYADSTIFVLCICYFFLSISYAKSHFYLIVYCPFWARFTQWTARIFNGIAKTNFCWEKRNYLLHNDGAISLLNLLLADAFSFEYFEPSINVKISHSICNSLCRYHIESKLLFIKRNIFMRAPQSRSFYRFMLFRAMICHSLFMEMPKKFNEFHSILVCLLHSSKHQLC